jgi:translation initiation factor 1
VTVAEPFHLTREDATALLADLKKACGGGGALKPTSDREGGPAFAIEVQGDHVERVLADLESRGYRVKRSGG